MKTVALLVAAGTIAVVGGKELAQRYVGDAPSNAGASASQAARSGSCWSPNKIKNTSFSHRGLPGSISSFEVSAVGGCVFNVKMEIVTPAGVRTLDFDAKYASGDRPIFVRYNTPP